MSRWDAYNKGQRTVKEGINTRDLEFVPLKNLCGSEVLVEGFFFTTGKFGEQVVVVGKIIGTEISYNINMPLRETETFKKIAANEEDVQAIFDGEMLFSDIKMIDTASGTTAIYTMKENKAKTDANGFMKVDSEEVPFN